MSKFKLTELRKEKPKHLYLCDPTKNKKCSGNGKPHCGITCFCTSDPKLSTDGHPLTNEEYYAQANIRQKGRKHGN